MVQRKLTFHQKLIPSGAAVIDNLLEAQWFDKLDIPLINKSVSKGSNSHTFKEESSFFSFLFYFYIKKLKNSLHGPVGSPLCALYWTSEIPNLGSVGDSNLGRVSCGVWTLSHWGSSLHSSHH